MIKHERKKVKPTGGSVYLKQTKRATNEAKKTNTDGPS